MARFLIYTIIVMLIASKFNSVFALYIVNKGLMKASLEGIARNINDAVSEAEKLFKPHKGLKKVVNLSLCHSLQILQIQKDYKIYLKFVDNNEFCDQYSSLHNSLLGKSILLIPNYDEKSILSWQCLTNVDEDIIPFRGGNALPANAESVVNEYSDNKYLGNCIYIRSDELNNIIQS